MTKDEYTALIEEEDKRHADKIKEIHMTFALANNPVNIGDILVCRNVTIKVEEIKFYCFSVYHEGPKLRKKDFKPYKSGARDSVCTESITSHIRASDIEKAD